MSQSLIKLKQVWQYLCDHGTLSKFSQLIDKCVKMAFHEVRGVWELKQEDDRFYSRVLKQMREPLHEAYIEYHDASTRDLPYPEYEQFMSAVRSCGFSINDKTLQNLTPEPKRLHDALRTAPPRQPVPSAAPAPPGTPGTRLDELLGRLRDLLDEFTPQPSKTPAAPAEDTRPASSAEDYSSGDGK